MSRTIIGLSILAALCIPNVAAATLFTVGTGGTYSTVQAALDAAANTPGEHLIKVRAGTSIGSIERQTNMVADRITITGGWSVFFTSRNSSPDATSIIATSQQRALSLALYHGEIIVDGFTFTGGHAINSESGGGVKVSLDSDTSFVMRNCRIVNNEVNSQFPYGGGLYLFATSTSHAEITDCTISGNSASSSGGASAASGAGIYLSASGQASVEMSWLRVEYNEAWSYSTFVQNAGLSIRADDAATVTIEDSVIANNSINGTGNADVAGATISASVLSHVNVRRVAFLDTANNTPASPDHIRVRTSDSSVINLVDSIIGPSTLTYYAIQVQTAALATVTSTNLTITGNLGYGYHGVAAGPNQSIYNSIVYGNGIDTLIIDPGVATGGNLVGTDPQFVDAAHRNYQIRTGSLAINSGTNSPPGGLGSFDFNHMERVHDGTVDVGAHEWGNIFSDGFELRSTNRWD